MCVFTSTVQHLTWKVSLKTEITGPQQVYTESLILINNNIQTQLVRDHHFVLVLSLKRTLHFGRQVHKTHCCKIKLLITFLKSVSFYHNFRGTKVKVCLTLLKEFLHNCCLTELIIHYPVTRFTFLLSYIQKEILDKKK